jgi:hypothetical protein
VQAVTFEGSDNQSALDHIYDVVDSELGIFFIDGAGDAVFFDRHTPITAPYTTSQATFSDKPAGDEFPYVDIVPSYDIDNLVNDWIGTRDGGTDQEADDAPSIDAYFRRSKTRTTLLTTDGEQLNQLQYLLAHSKDPLQRYDSVKIAPGNNAELWLQVLSRELIDRITVKENPPGGGDPTVQDVNIQHVHVSAGPGIVTNAVCEWQLSPADTTAYVVLDDAVNGKLDSNAIAF